MPKTAPNYYDLLGVLPTASMNEIKKAWRAQARRCHPDFNPQDPSAPERFKAVLEAYEVLGDPERRTHYDRSHAFINVKWNETRETHTEPPGPEEEDAILEELLRRVKHSAPPEEPLGPRSEAARKAAEAMRQRIQQAEHQEFWKTDRKQERSSTESPGQAKGPSSGGGPPPSSNPTSDSGPASQPSAGSQASAEKTSRDSRRPGTQDSSRPAAKDSSKEPAREAGKETGKDPSKDSARDAPRESTRQPGQDASDAQERRQDSRTTRRPEDAAISGPPSGGFPTDVSPGSKPESVLQRMLMSPWLSGGLFLMFLGLGCVAMVVDPPRAAFFVVLAFGCVTWRLLLEIRLRLDRLERRLR